MLSISSIFSPEYKDSLKGTRIVTHTMTKAESKHTVLDKSNLITLFILSTFIFDNIYFYFFRIYYHQKHLNFTVTGIR